MRSWHNDFRKTGYKCQMCLGISLAVIIRMIGIEQGSGGGFPAEAGDLLFECLMVKFRNKSHNKYAQNCPIFAYFQNQEAAEQRTFS